MKTGLYWKQYEYELLFLHQFNVNRSHHILYSFNSLDLLIIYIINGTNII